MKTTEEIAEATHEMNRRWCSLIGDDSQPEWKDAPEWQRESAVAGVEAVLNDVATTPEQQHSTWMDHKLADGWVWGEKKDPARREHPALVPYSELPLEQKAKDMIFRAVVFGFSSSRR